MSKGKVSAPVEDLRTRWRAAYKKARNLPDTRTITIFCTGCKCDVAARLTNGAEVYPHRPDLAELPFWRCDTCENYVGCHHKTDDPTRPLGTIPTPEIRRIRQEIHGVIDPLWKNRGRKSKRFRAMVYANLSKRLGYAYHTASIRSTDEARHVLQVAREVATLVEARYREATK